MILMDNYAKVMMIEILAVDLIDQDSEDIY